MFEHYYMTLLEEFVEQLYCQAGILKPEQLTVEELSQRLDVWVHFEDVTSRALESIPGMYSMFLDSRLPAEQQQLDFLHELCHLLRHAGNQVIMHKSLPRSKKSKQNTLCYMLQCLSQ
ncbi:Zn-dependent peptidase ImmA (M78 family) [Fontibacillus solani]|uniref:Zn-dependent peptidase ImmA (M78 family) n=1 Tax=Fontibacillus solani TaxID=1572857 RepID=A0A7W3XTK8_9BACL|nr:ImmA/IrrE family metallo-endopeptidase [Fontibacillus solani]MBA9087711.1 Zn-dependent peptidase ImmA (M78 family) [Fontibacillus solani]